MEPANSFLHNPELTGRLRELRRLDNVTNVFFLARTWLYLFLVIGGTIALNEWSAAQGAPLLARASLLAAAVLMVGAGQHQLAGATHEATHHLLFRNRWWNEIASDWLCMFPLYSSTYHFRLHHLAHHQFVNDPQRDPDFAQLAASGHRFDFPMAPQLFIYRLLNSLWPHKLASYILQRAKINSVGQGANPYRKTDSKPALWGPLLSALFVVVQGSIAVVVFHAYSVPGMFALPLLGWLAALAVIAFSPARWQLQSRMKPVIPLRWLAAERAAFITLKFTLLVVLARTTGMRLGLYYLLLWVLPLFTSFAFFMILRQVVQHGNADRGRLTNTRVFIVNPLLRFAVFPFGMDYHLPHHLFATVPHFRLKALDRFLGQFQEYSAPGLRAEGYFGKRHGGQTAPTVLECLGPAFAPTHQEVYEDEHVTSQDAMEPEKCPILGPAFPTK